MSILHKVEIKQVEDDYPQYAQVYIDGKPVKCNGYNIKHRVDEIPVITMSLLVQPSFIGEGVVHVDNVDMIARILERADFEELFKRWYEYHTEV